MKRISNIITIFLILIMINYTFYPIIIPTPPSNLDYGGNFAQNSSDNLADVYYILDLETTGSGYALYNIKNDDSSRWVSYYDLNHKLLWEDNPSVFEASGSTLYTSIEYVSIIHNTGSVLLTREFIENDTTYLTQYIDYFDPMAMIYDIQGNIISEFSIQLGQFDDNDISNNITVIPSIRAAIIQLDTIYMIEYLEYEYLNSSSKTIFFLHSYDIYSGELNWREMIDEVNNPTYIYYNIVEYSQFDLNKDVLLLKSFSNDIIFLSKYIISLDSNGITALDKEIKTYDCVGRCRDNLVMSFDEVIGINRENRGDEIIYTFISSYGYELDVMTSSWQYLNQPGDHDSGMSISGYSMNSKTMAVRGKISTVPEEYRYYFGLLTSDNKLELKLIDMNFTRVNYVRSVDVSRFLSINTESYDGDMRVVLWSMMKMNIVDWLNPFYKHLLPIILIAITIIIYKRRKRETTS